MIILDFEIKNAKKEKYEDRQLIMHLSQGMHYHY